MKKRAKRKKSLTQLIEQFHDNNRYFLPLLFISLVLMLTGVNYLGPLTITTTVNFNRTYLFPGNAYVIAVPLMKGWAFQANLLTNKAVNLSITNLDGEVIATSDDHTMIEFKAPVFDTYFLKLEGSNYALISLNYLRAGYGPYPVDYSLFASGLIIMLIAFIYYLIKPLKFSFKKVLDTTDALFYPILIVSSSIVFWIFVNASIWFYAKDFTASLIMQLVFSGVIVASAFTLLKRKLSPINRFVAGYALSFFTVYLLLMIKFTTSNIIDLIVFIAFAGLIVIYYYSRERVVLAYYCLIWFISSLTKLGIYSIGLPLHFGIVLATPVSWALLPALLILECFAVLACYFLVKGYYSKDIKGGLENGLYSAVFVQAFLQLMMVSSIML